MSNLTSLNENEQHSLCNVVLESEDEEKINISIKNPLLFPHESKKYAKIRN